MTVSEALFEAEHIDDCSGRSTLIHSIETLAAEVRRLRGELEAAHFVRSKIEHAGCEADLAAARAEAARLRRLIESAGLNEQQEKAALEAADDR